MGQLADLRAWLDRAPEGRASDIALAALALGTGSIAFAAMGGSPFGPLNRLNEWFFPAVSAGLLVLFGLLLAARGGLGFGPRAQPWSAITLLVITLTTAAIAFAIWQFGTFFMLQIGPSEMATLIVLALVLAIAFARRSVLRAAALVVLGLLVSTIGTDIETGTERYTFGIEALSDGIVWLDAVLGMIPVADAAICLLSPRVFVTTYARNVAGLGAPEIDPILDMLLRVASLVALVAVAMLILGWVGSETDLGACMAFGLVGVVSKLFGWNRVMLLLGLYLGPYLEEFIHRAMLISRGDPSTFLRWPFSGMFVLLAVATLGLTALLSARRSLATRRSP